MPKVNLSEEQKTRVALLVKALRSGRYKQAKGVLTKLDENGRIIGHCCLGVATQVAIKNGLKVSSRKVTDSGRRCVQYRTPGTPEHGTDWSEDTETTGLLPIVRDWFGFESRNPNIAPEEEGGKPYYSAAYANDSEGRNFKQIADLFEAKYLK